VDATFGSGNVLVNNSGIVLHKMIKDMSEKEYRRVIDIKTSIHIFRHENCPAIYA
jgi:NAD(P)-dependent dehydrogenase (short-subunit alcohol dehydrogenase family)